MIDIRLIKEAKQNTRTIALLLLFCLTAPIISRAEITEYDLYISYEDVNITGKNVKAMTINGGIPGPVLRFKEGDAARIRVHNTMDIDTSIHWHGLLVPPEMDGVPYISFPPIKPNSTFTYEFPIRQSGTYWYHSHTSLQEQRGLYGAIVIEPKETSVAYDKDYAVVLSDWTDEDPHKVLRTLKRGSEWYALQKGSSQSILGALKAGKLRDYFKRELMRMPPMDIADVAYDRFLVNGAPSLDLEAGPGETLRLRIVDGSATTFFYLEFAGGPMTIISSDGQPVEPVKKQRFLIGVAETYDVLVKIPGSGSYELRVTAHDGSAHASIWLGSGVKYPAPGIPKPDVYHFMGGFKFNRIFALTPAATMGMSESDVQKGRFDNPGMAGMEFMHTMHMPGMDQADMDAQRGSHHDHAQVSAGDSGDSSNEKGNSSKHNEKDRAASGNSFGRRFGFLTADASSAKKTALDGTSPDRPGTPYKDLRALRPTVFSKDRPVREIRLTLDGDMERYVWFINNKPLSETDTIRIKEGEVVRFIMINRTMMHHPMHLHGHFFRVINGQGDYSPLRHTVDVEPMSTTVIEFDANEVGDWFFHCHLLYHMKSGMARVIHYEDFAVGSLLADIRPNLYKEEWYLSGRADVLSHMSEGVVKISDTRNIISVQWETGWQEVEDTEWEAILTYDRYINRFFSVFAGADLHGEKNILDKSRGILGLRYILALNVESRIWIDSDKGARVNLEKSFHLTPRLDLFGEIEYDTHKPWEGSAGLAYRLNRDLSLLGRWHSEYGWGAGMRVEF